MSILACLEIDFESGLLRQFVGRKTDGNVGKASTQISWFNAGEPNLPQIRLRMCDATRWFGICLQ